MTKELKIIANALTNIHSSLYIIMSKNNYCFSPGTIYFGEDYNILEGKLKSLRDSIEWLNGYIEGRGSES